MTKRHLHLRRLAVGGASVALAATGLAVSTAPAHADSAPLNYTCERPLGSSDLKATFSAPAKVPVGGKAKVITSVEVPADLTELLGGVGVATIEGSAVGQATVNEVPIEVPQSIPVTDVPTEGALTVKATGAVQLPTDFAAGTVLSVSAGDFGVTLDGKTAEGEPSLLSPYDISCVQDADQDATVGDIKVVKAGSKTKLKVKGKKKKAVVKVKVASKTSAKATGKVKVALKGPKKVTKKVKVNKKGVAKFTVKKLKKGKYKVNAKYLGNKNVKASKAKAKVKVK